jgi:hypothetical protein
MQPKETILLGDRVYKRKPWRRNFFALIFIGYMENVIGKDGKPTGDKTFRPHTQSRSATDPLKASKKAAKLAKQSQSLEKPKGIK